MDMKALAEEMAPVIKEYFAQALAPLADRVKALEDRPEVKYAGVYQRGTEYRPGEFVTHEGSMWACIAKTTSSPGEASGGWKLAVKRGKDAR